MTPESNLETTRRYITALSSGAGPDDVAQFFVPDVVQVEFPNRLVPRGATRDLAAIRDGRIKGQALLRAENFEIHNAIASADQVAMELTWTGTIGIDAGPFKAGQELRARFGIFLTFRDGKIARQHNYDCFDPWD